MVDVIHLEYPAFVPVVPIEDRMYFWVNAIDVGKPVVNVCILNSTGWGPVGHGLTDAPQECGLIRGGTVYLQQAHWRETLDHTQGFRSEYDCDALCAADIKNVITSHRIPSPGYDHFLIGPLANAVSCTGCIFAYEGPTLPVPANTLPTPPWPRWTVFPPVAVNNSAR